MIIGPRDLLVSRHRMCVPLGQGVSSQGIDVTNRYAGMAMLVTTAKLEHRLRLWTETIHTQVSEFWQSVLAPVAAVHYLTFVRLSL